MLLTWRRDFFFFFLPRNQCPTTSRAPMEMVVRSVNLILLVIKWCICSLNAIRAQYSKCQRKCAALTLMRRGTKCCPFFADGLAPRSWWETASRPISSARCQLPVSWCAAWSNTCWNSCCPWCLHHIVKCHLKCCFPWCGLLPLPTVECSLSLLSTHPPTAQHVHLITVAVDSTGTHMWALSTTTHLWMVLLPLNCECCLRRGCLLYLDSCKLPLLQRNCQPAMIQRIASALCYNAIVNPIYYNAIESAICVMETQTPTPQPSSPTSHPPRGFFAPPQEVFMSRN